MSVQRPSTTRRTVAARLATRARPRRPSCSRARARSRARDRCRRRSCPRRDRSGRRRAATCSGAIPGPSSSTSSDACSRSALRPQRHARPRRRVHERVLDAAHGRSAAPAARRRGRRAALDVDLDARASGARASAPNSSRDARATSPRSTGSCSTRIRPASSRERSSRSVASFVRRSTCSRIVSRNSRRVSSSSSSSASSSRKPPSEKSGVRSSCDALAMNSLRARSSLPSRTRMRSNASREFAELVVARVDDRLVEAAAGDPLGCALEPPDPRACSDAST